LKILIQKNHSVLSKETLYGIARQYGVTVEDLNKLNPTLQIRIEKEIKSNPRNRIKSKLSRIFCGTNKRNSKNTVPEKNSSRRSELLLKSNETKEPTSEVVVREILPKQSTYKTI
jgi:LysM repeat protein